VGAVQTFSVSLPCVDDTQLWEAQKKSLTAGANGDWDTCLASAGEGQRLAGFATSFTLNLMLACAENRTIARGQPLGPFERRLLYDKELLALREIRYVPEELDKIRGRILTSISILQRAGFASLAADLEAELQKAQQVEPSHQGALPAVTAPSRAEEISLVKVGGVYALPVEINSVLTLNFVLDSGSAEVNIPADVVLTLVRTGTIKDTDFLPGATYVLADGSEVKGPRFTIRSLKIGSHHIPDVPASIGDLNSPLLLGQSLLEKLGTWGIDNKRMVLLIQPGASQTSTASLLPQPQGAAIPPASVPACPPVEGNVADQLYKRALKDYQERNYEAAVVNFKQYLKQSPKSPQAGTAQYLIGDSLYALKQYEAAIVAFDEVVQKHSQDPKAAAAMLKQGYAFAELRDARNARFFLQQVQKKFPNTPEAQQAAEMLRYLR